MSIIANDANRAARPDEGDRTLPNRYPLSSGQRRAWFLQTRDPGDTALNLPVVYRLHGTLDSERLCAAVRSVVDRHEILRTTYGLDSNGEPYQQVRTDLPLPWQEHDLTDLAAEPARRRAEVFTRRALARPFDPAAETPLRVTLIRLAASEYLLVLVVHTIAWDDESASVFAADLSAAYNGTARAAQPVRFVEQSVEAAGGDGAIPSARVPHAGRPARETAPPDGPEYWRQALTPLPEALELPGRPVPREVGPATIDTTSRPLPVYILDQVRKAATEPGTSETTVLLAGFAALVHRYTGAVDFLVALPADTRGPRAAGMIGYFGNTVLIRATPRPVQSFAEFHTGLAGTVADGHAHRHIGIDEVVHAVNPDRTGARDGLEQLARIGFAVREPHAVPELAGVRATLEKAGSPDARVPLRITVVLDRDRPRLVADHRPGQLDRALVEQLLAHYVQLLDSALRDPAARLGELDLFGDRDRAALLARSHGELVPEAPATLVALVEQRVAAAGDATAVVAPAAAGGADLELSYRELNSRANRLARGLVAHGIGTEDLVGVRIANSAEFVVAVLGVLKAGAAYLPIDPSYPDQRIDFLDRDARPRLVLGRAELAAAEASAADLPGHDLSDSERVRPLRPGNLAYVIYTSGSTGTPKGVGVAHAAIADHLRGFGAEWDMTAQDRLLQSSSVSFDASLLDIFVTLSLGACLVIPKPDALRDIPYISELIGRYGVTVLHMVPSLLSTFLLLPEVTEWRALRRVPVGGEALLGEVADRFAGVFDAELRNHYGPTEAVVSATHLTVRGPQGTGMVPVGVPNRNVYVYVLDNRLQLVPGGVLGEIYLGGAQLARGYLHRPGLTAERFVADPFLPGQRLYRTGDLARRNSRGEIEFAGRADEQVKVRGHRIESGEVQAALSAHPGVGACAVVAFPEPVTGTALAAYLVPAAGDLDVAEVRAFAAKSLPDYMLPTAWAVLAEIPLTEHGKLDKRALPEPRRFGTGQRRPPSSPTEVRLAGLFGALFGCADIGADDSLFELGGHSLLANRLILLIREEFGVEIDVRAPFDTPTVAGLAALVDATPVTATGRPELDRRPRPERIPLSYNQRAVLGGADIGPVELMADVDGRLDRDALMAAVHDVFERYEILRTVPAVVDDEWYQAVRAGPYPDTAVFEIAEEGRSAVRCDRAAGPLLHFRLRVTGADRYVLELTADRFVADEWSLRIVLDDLATAYRSRAAQGTAPRWPGPAVDYADYALWQSNVVESAGPQLEQLRAGLRELPGPSAGTESGQATEPARSATFTVSSALRRRLRAHAETVGASEYMLYQAVVAALLHALGAGVDIALGAPLSGRADSAVSEMVGPLSAAVVLRHDLSGDPALRTVLDRARGTAFGVYGGHDMLIDAIAPAVCPGRSPYDLCRAVVDFGELCPPQQIWLGDEVAARITDSSPGIAHRLVFAFGSAGDGGLHVTLRADAARHDQQTTEQLARYLEELLTTFVESPDIPVSEAVSLDATRALWTADGGLALRPSGS
ncbi:non-ribosomal peptide synthetase [Nocardia flavorosea]|uniref:Non-ribosomal peptide synthetase n=1 Tax=Nocardia flavorosea TaxID=53429 RepID=A0A846YD06_9NOCA|nr:non-ribosomal peptide synthetase [Nocardia flavorosea]NKY56933.1 non-ribosomal peptide synthetase [Nocardia flavorosea]